MTKNSLADVICPRQEREIVGSQTTIDTSPHIVVAHAPHQVEENMLENHSRGRLGFFARRSKPHVPSETRVFAEMKDASGDAPTIIC